MDKLLDTFSVWIHILGYNSYHLDNVCLPLINKGDRRTNMFKPRYISKHATHMYSMHIFRGRVKEYTYGGKSLMPFQYGKKQIKRFEFIYFDDRVEPKGVL